MQKVNVDGKILCYSWSEYEVCDSNCLVPMWLDPLHMDDPGSRIRQVVSRFLQRQIRKIQLTYGSKMIQGPSEAFFFRAMILGASRVSKIGPEISGVQILTTDPSAGMPWIPTRSHQRASWLKRGWIPENNTILENTINHGTVRFLL